MSGTRAMNTSEAIRVAATGLGNGCRDDLVQAIAEKGWKTELTPDVRQLASVAVSGAYHLAVIVCQDPYALPKETVRALMSLQADMSVLFLVPGGCRIAECAPLMGATSDQIRRLDCPTTELIQVLEHELQSVLANQPDYTVVCVDDDEEFLASLESFLSVRLKKALPRFGVNLESFVNPREALEEISDFASECPAVIISDQIMPEMAGIELLKKAKGLRPETRCVLLTGHAALDSAVTAINEQILDKYYLKPVEDPVDFANNIRHLLLEHHLRDKADKQRNYLMAQFEFIRTISATKDIDRALAVAVDFLRAQIRPEQIVIALVQDDICTVRAGAGLPAELAVGTDVGDHKVLRQALDRRWPVVVDASAALTSTDDVNSAESCSMMALPLVWADAAPGVILMVGRGGKCVFTRHERMLASFTADVTAMTVCGFEDRRALEDVYLGTMATLMETVEAKDVYTRGHTDRVTELSVALAKGLGIGGEQLEDIRRAAALHDIGKIALPDRIILKPGPLDDEERFTVQEHCARAERILQHLRFLDSVRIIARAHHERYDGTGYPDGLKGEEIPFGARILAVADSYDAMTSVRPYREAMSQWDALAEIEANAGKQFDPHLAAAFVEMMRSGAFPRPAAAGKLQAAAHKIGGENEEVPGSLH